MQDEESSPEMIRDSTGPLLLLCDAQATIVYSQGNWRIMGIRHQQLHGNNLFQLGFTQHALLLARKKHHRGILPPRAISPVVLNLEFVPRDRLFAPQQPDNYRDNVLILCLKCSRTKVAFGDGPVAAQQIEFRRIGRVPPPSKDSEEWLWVVEVLPGRGPIATKQPDYQYTIDLLLNDCEHQ